MAISVKEIIDNNYEEFKSVIDAIDLILKERFDGRRAVGTNVRELDRALSKIGIHWQRKLSPRLVETVIKAYEKTGWTVDFYIEEQSVLSEDEDGEKSEAPLFEDKNGNTYFPKRDYNGKIVGYYWRELTPQRSGDEPLSDEELARELVASLDSKPEYVRKDDIKERLFPLYTQIFTFIPM